LRGEVGGNNDGVIDIEVLEENWNTVAVFRHCQPGFITGLHAPVYVGISALELQAACALLRIVPDADLIAGIKVMSEETARVYSTRHNQRERSHCHPQTARR